MMVESCSAVKANAKGPSILQRNMKENLNAKLLVTLKLNERELPFTYARTANISNTNVSNVESLSHLMSKMLRCGSIIYGYYDTHCCKFVLR